MSRSSWARIASAAARSKGDRVVEVRSNVIVPLAYGKYVWADKVVGLEPLDERENRGAVPA